MNNFKEAYLEVIEIAFATDFNGEVALSHEKVRRIKVFHDNLKVVE